MATVETSYVQTARQQLESRLERLESLRQQQPSEQLAQLITAVDEALERIDTGHFGECTVCHDSVEPERLMHDPAISVCLGCLSPKQQRALEYDLELAGKIQNGLLPPEDLAIPGWQVAYHYRPAGVVGGDYCDVLSDGKGGAYFLIADVAGKGVSAAMLTTNLRAAFRALVPMGQGVEAIMRHANRLFCESKLPMQYATVVFGHGSAAGEVQLVNAGHLPALVMQGNTMRQVESGGLPLGLFCEQEFVAEELHLTPGDMLVLFTDGISEAQNPAGDEYSVEKLQGLLRDGKFDCPAAMVRACRECVQEFRSGSARADDETLLGVQFLGAVPTSVV